MPWQFEPKKDACLSAKSTISSPTNIISRWFPNGATLPPMAGFLSQDKKATRRTETSKYPEEKKSIEIP